MKKIVSALFLMLGIGVVGTLVSVSATGGFSLDTYKVEDKIVIDESKFNTLLFNFSSSDVNVLPSKEEKITVELDGKVSRKFKEKLKLESDGKGDTLEVTLTGQDQLKFNIGVLIIDTNITVYIPEKSFEEISVITSSGEVKAKDLLAKNLHFKASSGELEVSNCRAEGVMSLSTSSGEIVANGLDADTIEAEASSGTVVLDKVKAGFSTIETSSGEIEISQIKGDVMAKASSGSISILNEQLYGNINAEASSGEITVEFKENPSSLKIDFSGSSGEGNIDIENVSYQTREENRIVGIIGSGNYELNVRTSSGDFYVR